MWILYQLLYTLLLILSGPVLILKRGRHYLATLPRRLGVGRPAAAPGALWFHAVSVGEARVAATLASRLEESRVLVTTITPTGQQTARELFDERAVVDYLPFELGWSIRGFLRHHAPRGLVLTEGDYWPLLLRHVARQGLPIAVVNGRVGDRSFARMRRLRRWLGPLLGRIDSFGVQTSEDRTRLLSLGVPESRVRVTGNLKFEAPEPAAQPELDERLLDLAGGRPILVAGSTMEGEESAVLEAFAAVGGGATAMLLLAPRHPERWSSVAAMIEARLGDQADGGGLARRSEAASLPAPAVFLLDSMGELAAVYRLAAAAFVGGTLVPTGGHNPIEPARFAVPLTVGPSMHNFRDIAEQFDRQGAWRRISSAHELGEVWKRWLDDSAEAAAIGDAAAELIAANQGALERSVALVREVVSRQPSPLDEASSMES